MQIPAIARAPRLVVSFVIGFNALAPAGALAEVGNHAPVPAQGPRDQSAQLPADLESKRVVFNEVDPAEVARVREKLRPVIGKYTKQVGEDLVKQADAEIEKIRPK
jgi:hypothetical protein